MTNAVVASRSQSPAICSLQFAGPVGKGMRRHAKADEKLKGSAIDVGSAQDWGCAGQGRLTSRARARAHRFVRFGCGNPFGRRGRGPEPSGQPSGWRGWSRVASARPHPPGSRRDGAAARRAGPPVNGEKPSIPGRAAEQDGCRTDDRPTTHSAPGDLRIARERTDMAIVTMRQLLESGVHFGHQTRRWNPKMSASSSPSARHLHHRPPAVH